MILFLLSSEARHLSAAALGLASRHVVIVCQYYTSMYICGPGSDGALISLTGQAACFGGSVRLCGRSGICQDVSELYMRASL